MTIHLALKYLRVEALDAGIVQVILDDPEKSANVLTEGLQADLQECLDYLHGRKDLRGVILRSGKPRIFVAGADLVRIVKTLDWPAERIVEFCERGRRLYQRFREGPFVSVAAIQGACLGGGWELALGCDYQICVDDPKTFLGLPEVKLGLVPGWAGTVRVPRLAGLEAALDWVTSGRNVTVGEAHRLGLLQAIVPADQLIPVACAQIAEAWAHRSHLAKRLTDLCEIEIAASERADLQERWRRRIESQTDIHPFAATAVADHMIRSCDWEFEKACCSEAETMTRVYGSPSSYGLLNQFFLNEHNRKHPGRIDVKPAVRTFDRIGIVGLGLMGQAIARACLKRAARVSGFDLSPAAAAGAQQKISDSRFERVDDFAAFHDCDLLIEAVSERAEVKLEVLHSLSRVASPQAAIATNTSTICLSRLADAVSHPTRFCGIHFCHPTLMNLVELVSGKTSDPSLVSDLVHWARGLGKTPLVVQDAPGFVVNRLLSALIEAAIQLACDGNRIDEIDQALRAFGFQGGPFEMIDLIGLETTALAGRSLLEAGVPQVSRNPILLKLIHSGRLGRNTGCGFYDYPDPDSPEKGNPTGDPFFDPYRPNDPKRLPPAELTHRLLAAMLLSACEILSAGTVDDPRDIDLAALLGLSFPAHVGGLFFWAQRTGSSALQASLEWNRSRFLTESLPESYRAWLGGVPFYSTV